MPPAVGQVALGVYAVLLAVGGVMGYVKAKSRPSLVAGSASALVAAVALFLSMNAPRYGFALGLVLAAGLLGLFGSRFRKSGKFMPAGLLAVVSLVMLVVMALALAVGQPAS